jgi:ABC-2 type transport system ATP-binding protein
MNPTLELRNLRKSFRDVRAVDGVSLAVPPGKIFGLLGPNGAGKTTTIRMIMDILAPDAGEVLIFGRHRRREDLERIGYLPEERGLYRKMGVLDHLAFLGELHGLRRRDALARAGRWLERLGLADWGKRKVEELSKGMAQKVQIAGTVLHEPELVILDEPFSGLDPINQGLFKDLLADYKRDGKTVVFSTHVMEQAERLCDEICLISRGRTVLAGELAAIKHERGANFYRLLPGGDLARLAGVAGVEQVTAGADGAARLRLAADADPATVLRALVARVEVREFASEEPALADIFVQAVNAAAAPEVAAGGEG